MRNLIDDRIREESKARILSSLTQEWLSTKEIARKSSTSFPKTVLVLKKLAESGRIEARMIRDKHDATKARWEYRAKI
jgi:hypothetical protein